MKFGNSGEALVQKLGELLTEGQRVDGRGGETLELLHQHIVMTSPLDRAAVVHGRHGDVFANIAESLWVLAGRNDLGFLERYLPRAPLFSDDGSTWRGGYGPRLRNWSGTDQLRQTYETLASDPSSRRAVMVLFDPGTDFVESRDIPCTNWLQADVRNGKLNLSVVMRSNDLVWGFSGINAFEWSLLQEMLAFWLKVAVGELHFYVGSLHLYERHYERARRIVAGPGVVSSPPKTRSQFATPLAELDEVLDHWFAFEAAICASSPDADHLVRQISDPLLRDYALMVAASWRYARDGSEAGRTALAEVSDDALRVAGAAVFDWREGREAEQETAIDLQELRPAILALHRAKDATYGDSWKRRGERGSILPNIARKLDRFREYSLVAATPGDETWFDTAVDLLVYAVKYHAYLIDQAQAAGIGTLSDGPDGVEALLPALDNRSMESFEQILAVANAALERLERLADADASSADRISCVLDLIDEAANLTMRLAEESPWRTRSTLRRWIALP